ncbi:MAG TPA: nuclear transport factor 2 family protein [Candidatus Dormibacteraeota bacterium]|jgi:ketosteroid isomerase-like protein|nr:nuclear transport factor 2 family protein [Candidatus Dormibacteraeota bacterium]
MAGFNKVIFNGESKTAQRITALIVTLAVALSFGFAPDAHAQNKKKKNAPQPTINNDSAHPVVPLTDEQQIDYMLSEYLGAWQLGDTEKMHKEYSDDVSVVGGGWNPPILGWTSYVALYQQQRSHMERVRMDRMNTYVKVNGTTAWVCYLWEFEAVVDGAQTLAHGQTTLVLVKKDTRWLIVHDHTSVVDSKKQGQPAAAPAGAPANTPSQPSKPPAQ